MTAEEDTTGYDPKWVVREMQRLARDTVTAQKTADSALQEIGTHERECALRYQEVTNGLAGVTATATTLFSKLDKVAMVVYTGVGIMIAVPALIAIVIGLRDLLGH